MTVNWVDWIGEIIRAPLAFFALIWLVMLFGVGAFLVWALTAKIIHLLWINRKRRKVRIGVER